MQKSIGTSGPPAATSDDTVDEIVNLSGRSAVPIRVEFLQAHDADGQVAPGPLSEFVRSGDRRGLLLYLLAVTKASTDPWDTALPAAVWARALGLDLPLSNTATSTVSKAWRRIEGRQLVARRRRKRMSEVTLLREDGTGTAYTHPGVDKDRYLKLPHAFWLEGPTDKRWFRVLELPEIAMLLVSLSLTDGFRLPFESVPEWYGLSADTAARGLHGLEDHDLITIDKSFKKAPLAPAGYTAENRYTLRPPFGPRSPQKSKETNNGG